LPASLPGIFKGWLGLVRGGIAAMGMMLTEKHITKTVNRCQRVALFMVTTETEPYGYRYNGFDEIG